MRRTLLLGLALVPFAAFAQAPQTDWNAPLVGNKDYSIVAEDYVATYAKARALPVDVFLGLHEFFYGLGAKYTLLEKRQPSDPNPFVDYAGYLAPIAMQEQRFKAMLTTQQAAAHSH